MEDRNFWDPRKFLLKDLHTDLCGLTPSEPQCGDSRLKTIRHIQRRTELSSMTVRGGGQLSPRQKCWQRPLFLFGALTPQRWPAGFISETHIYMTHCLTHPGDFMRLCLTHLVGPTKLFPVAFPNKWLILAHASDIPKFSQTGGIWLQRALCHLLSCPRSDTSSSQPWFTAWPCLGISKPITRSSHLEITL